MSRGRRVGLLIAGIVVVALAAVVIVFGVVGIGQTVSAGGQTRVCGVPVGVSVSEGTVRLVGVSDEPLGPGDRVRVSPLCVVEVVAIDDTGAGPGDDGGGARVDLRWRLW